MASKQELLKRYDALERERAREAALTLRLESAGKKTEAAPHRARAMALVTELHTLLRTIRSTPRA